MALRSKYCHISTSGASALMYAKSSRFVVHQHRTGRTHYDLRIVQNGVLRSWSLLKEPPCRDGERRLAIERESFTEDSIDSKNFEEQAFGLGRVSSWDEGEFEVELASSRLLVLTLMGAKLSGKYEFRRMRWYPGNRWLLTKLRIPETRQNIS
jgi:bifunctional non-homologous end joining protein LigD